MFSPDARSHTHSLRPKRTRQAAGPDDSLKLPQAKRKRSALRRDTFEPLTDASLNEIAGRNNGGGSLNGHAISSEKSPSSNGPQSKELTLRGGKKADKRLDRSNGALTLSSNEFYTVAQLPALPDQIRNRPAVPYSCAVSPEYGYALALTHSDALIWPYNSSSTSPSSRDLLSFKLPFPPSSALDPLPLAAFTARSAGGEPGIVAVSPKWGKVVFWETITNASSFVPGQTSSGVQGSIPGMLSGETIKEITNAEPAGFILSFSHGRVAHLTIKDQMGRPGIGLQFLRKPVSGGVGGLFGSIRHALGGDRRKGVPIVRAGKSSKGQRDVFVAAEDGEVEFWNTNLGVGNSMVKSMNIREDILDALRHNLPNPSGNDLLFKLLDIELVAGPGSGQELARVSEAASTPVAILAALSQSHQTTYYIIESIITGTNCTIKVVHPIKCYTAPLSESALWRPKLHLPKFSEMAFIVFEKAVVLFSLARIEESPSSQLLLERNALPDPFQDCIRFQDDTIYRVLGLAIEDHERNEKQSSCVFAVQGFGVVRVTAIGQQRSQDDEDEEFVTRISPKSKIEQAVFFGTIRQNPLDLMSSTAGQSFTAEEISSAALEISSEILSSSSKYLPKTTPSIDMQMRLRAKALEDLAHYLIKHFSSSLSRATRFQLLWNAEKLASAQAIWKVQEGIQRRYPDLKDREMTYMQFVLKALHESRQTYAEPSKGESDTVRHWLANDPGRVGHFVTELVACVDENELTQMDITDPRVVVDYLREADDLWIAAYEAAFKFREDNAHTYGLGNEVFKDGVLLSGYPETLPQVWTSDSEPFNTANEFIFNVCKFLDEWWDFNPVKSKKKMPTDEEGRPHEAPSKKAMVDLAQRLPIQVELFCRLLDEESIHAQQQAKLQEHDPATVDQIVKKIKDGTRPRLRAAVRAIARFNMSGAINLAEKLGDTGLLVDLNTEHLRRLAAEQILTSASDPVEAAKLEAQIAAVQSHAETYYETFGNGWAFAHFSHKMREGEVSSMLQEAQADQGKKQKYLSWFLKKCKLNHFPVGKVSWINEIVGERRYERAQKTLESVARDEEEDLWGKRTEICLAKLAKLAASEDSVARGGSATARVEESKEYDHALAMLDVQDSVYAHIAPAMAQTIDIFAAQDVAADIHAKRVTAKSPGLKRVLRRGLDGVVEKRALSPSELVDVLTLMDPVEFSGADDEEDPGVLGREFGLALKVIEVADALGQAEKEALRRLVWRRAMVRDDWIALNETSLKDDETVERDMMSSSLFRCLVQVLEEGKEGVALCSPRQILEAEVFPPSLQHNYEETQLKGIEKDLEVEQGKLRLFVEKGRLDMHFDGLVRTAGEVVRGVRDREGDEMARRVLGERDIEMDMSEEMVESNGIH